MVAALIQWKLTQLRPMTPLNYFRICSIAKIRSLVSEIEHFRWKRRKKIQLELCCLKNLGLLIDIH